MTTEATVIMQEPSTQSIRVIYNNPLFLNPSDLGKGTKEKETSDVSRVSIRGIILSAL